MRTITFLTIILCFSLHASAQSLLKMEYLNGKHLIPCKLNGLTMKVGFDTGEQNASISITDVLFMLKHGYLTTNEIIGTEHDPLLRGYISTGAQVILKQLEIADTKFTNITAFIVSDLNAPLIIGQDILKKLGKIELDFTNQLFTLKNNPKEPVMNAPNLASRESNDKVINTKKLLVKANTKLYSLPNSKQFITEIRSDTFVKLIDGTSTDNDFIYVDYLGSKGYIDKLALEIR
jgi:hypothetical protein